MGLLSLRSQLDDILNQGTMAISGLIRLHELKGFIMAHGTNGRFHWERDRKLKMASYARDLDATRFLPYEEKFSGLLSLWEEAKKGEFEIVVVAKPEILGDNYEELVGNLRRSGQGTCPESKERSGDESDIR